MSNQKYPAHTSILQSSSFRIGICMLGLAVLLTGTGQSQTYNVIHNFTGGRDGATPYAGVTIDRAGNLYGTTYAGGVGFGSVYKMVHHSGGWTLNPLYDFLGGTGGAGYDGAGPYFSPPIIGPDGSLYGSTVGGGGQNFCGDTFGYWDCGTIYRLRPSATACTTAICPWTETVLFAFGESVTDGAAPFGQLVFDQAGNLYGTTSSGFYVFHTGYGTVFELTEAGGNWTQTVLYAFGPGPDGAGPYAGVVFDHAGNLYGTTTGGGYYQNGAVFQLQPSGSGWTESILYNFLNASDGWLPQAGLTWDQAGNLYGATLRGGGNEAGTAFELSPSGAGWSYDLTYTFSGGWGGGPMVALTADSQGNLYGTGWSTALGYGSVFKLTPGSSGWTYTSLHDFTGGSDGMYPVSTPVLDSHGNIYGTTSQGGANGLGVVWEITP